MNYIGFRFNYSKSSVIKKLGCHKAKSNFQHIWGFIDVYWSKSFKFYISQFNLKNRLRQKK